MVCLFSLDCPDSDKPVYQELELFSADRVYVRGVAAALNRLRLLVYKKSAQLVVYLESNSLRP